MPVQCTCSVCGKSHLVKPYLLKLGQGKFCSTECRYQAPPPCAILNADGVSALIPLSAKKRGTLAYAIIDVADVEWAQQRWWYLDQNGYAATGKGERLHRLLMGLTVGDPRRVDHISRDRLDDRRSNLRFVPLKANAQNMSSHADSTSKHRGVCWDKRARKWVAAVQENGRRRHLGYFTDELEAANVARQARMRLMPYATD